MVGIQMIIEQPNEIPATAAPAPSAASTQEPMPISWVTVALAIIGVYLLYQYMQKGE